MFDRIAFPLGSFSGKEFLKIARRFELSVPSNVDEMVGAIGYIHWRQTLQNGVDDCRNIRRSNGIREIQAQPLRV